MKLSVFDYKLPADLIAQEPLKRRDSSRMLVLNRKTGKTEHRHFSDLLFFLRENDVIVFNNTKVFKARLFGNIEGGLSAIELLVLRKVCPFTFECLARPARKIKIGDVIVFSNALKARLIKTEGMMRVFKFNKNKISDLNLSGCMPLPPYIKRSALSRDDIRYQTVYAKKTGAIAAPTAGLHFTKNTIKKSKEKGIKTAELTLHVGYGTFAPVKDDDIKNHRMHSEFFDINKKTAYAINKAKHTGNRLLAVGTTVCRALESAVSEDIKTADKTYLLNAKKGYTDLFIKPGYCFRMTDMLLTNFHLPKTTLLMLVCAFAGFDNTMRAYKEAVKNRYRFYSYGDCMLIV